MGIAKDRERAEKERHRAKGKIVDVASLRGEPSGNSVWEEVDTLEGASISKLKRELARKEKAKAQKTAERAKAKRKPKGEK